MKRMITGSKKRQQYFLIIFTANRTDDTVISDMKHKLKLLFHVLDPFQKVLRTRKEEHLAGNALRIPLQ